MKHNDKHIALLLLLVSVLMQAVPVFPHHHHGAHAAICLRHDQVAHDDGALPAGESDCEHSGCVASLFAFNPVDSEHHTLPSPWEQWTLAVEIGALLPACPTVVVDEPSPLDVQSYDGLHPEAHALRAPPFVLVA